MRAHRPYARFLCRQRTVFRWRQWSTYNPYVKRAGKLTVIFGEIL
jgi:hypothetical protein